MQKFSLLSNFQNHEEDCANFLAFSEKLNFTYCQAGVTKPLDIVVNNFSVSFCMFHIQITLIKAVEGLGTITQQKIAFSVDSHQLKSRNFILI